MKRKELNIPNALLFQTDGICICPVDETKISSILDVYRQSEDFVSLGPKLKASLKMVRDDIEHSKKENGLYCYIQNSSGNIVGVLDFLPNTKEDCTSFLSLLMIAKPFRRKGYGQAIMTALEKYLEKIYKTKRIKSAVQTNNNDAIRFWRKAGYIVDNKPEHRSDETIVYNMSKELRLEKQTNARSS